MAIKSTTTLALPTNLLTDPLKMLAVCWPHITLYDDQVDIIESVARGNKVTMVPAGNMLGKDFISAFISLWFFCSRTPCRVLTSSVDHSQLEGVLWGEIRRWIDTSKYPLGIKSNHLHLKQLRSDGSVDPLSEMIGRVAQRGVPEGLLGRHVARGPNGQSKALGVVDEASGFEDIHKNAMETWVHQLLVIGNCYPCTNFFREGVKDGDLPNPYEPGLFYRKVFRIPAERSPNVRYALAEIAAGKKASNTEIIPGCISYQEYLYRRATWDKQRQTVGLDAKFYEGEEVKLYPANWLLRSQEMAEVLDQTMDRRMGRAIGVDVAEGGDSTVWTVIDEWGILEQIAKKTRDTSVIFGETIALMETWEVLPENTIFDHGGGGKVHVDYLNDKGYPVRGVSFGSAPTPDPRSKEAYKKGDGDAEPKGKSAKAAYKNRRAEMYGLFRNRINPNAQSAGIAYAVLKYLEGRAVFAIPAKYTELLRQLGPLPLLYDAEGVMYLPPKDKPHGGYKGTTIKAILGCSPDESDSLVLAHYGLCYPVIRSVMTVF